MRKKNIYVGMTGGFGSLAQVLPILDALDSQKYHIQVSIKHGAQYAVQQLGYDFIPYPEIGNPDFVTAKGRMWCDLDHYWGRFGFADSNYFSRLVESRLELVKSLKPDLLITQFCPPTEIISRITGIPLLCVTQSCWHPRGKSLTWWHKPEAEYQRVTPATNQILQKYNLPPISRMEDLNQGDLTIIPSFPEFDPIADDKVHYSGPMNWQSALEIPSDFVLSEKQKSRPRIMVYTGHLWDSGGDSGILILENIWKAFRNEEFDVIVTTGMGQEIDFSQYPADNIRFEKWVPLTEILPSCDLFIHHGGHGSCMAAIQKGIPSLVIPTFQEREFNARQLEGIELGDYLLPDDLNPKNLLKSVNRIISTQKYYETAVRWQNVLKERNYSGGVGVAKLVDKFLHEKS